MKNRRQKTENRKQKSEDRIQKSENVCSLFSVLCFLSSVLCFLFQFGCESVPAAAELPPPAGDNAFSQPLAYPSYMPARIDILPLTRTGNVGEMPAIKVYVSLLDEFDCQIKAPTVFRFELYEYVQRSAEPKGRRISIWPDIDLTQPTENNRYWRDFLRAYEFTLEFESIPNQSFILQVTSLCPGGKRLSAELALDR